MRPDGTPLVRCRRWWPGSAPTRLARRVASLRPRWWSHCRTGCPVRDHSTFSHALTYCVTDGWRGTGPVGAGRVGRRWGGRGGSSRVRPARWARWLMAAARSTRRTIMTRSMASPRWVSSPDQHRQRWWLRASVCMVTDGWVSWWSATGQCHRRRCPLPVTAACSSRRAARSLRSRTSAISHRGRLGLTMAGHLRRPWRRRCRTGGAHVRIGRCGRRRRGAGAATGPARVRVVRRGSSLVR